MFKTKENMYSEFIVLLQELDVVEVLGIGKLLGVDFFKDEEKKEAREGEEIIKEIKEGFLGLGRKQKRELLSAMRQVVKKQNKGKRKGK